MEAADMIKLLQKDLPTYLMSLQVHYLYQISSFLAL